LPAWEAWEAGQITKRQATLLVHTTDQLGDDLDKAHKAEERILPRMPARAQGSEDGRTLAQRRADALCTMILNPSNTTPGQDPATPAALVQVTVSLETLLALNAQPGELERYGAISADTARALAMAPGSLWRWLAYDPDTGTLIKTAPRVYQPTTEVRRFVQARDRVCALPGCTRPAYRCDLDHVNPFNHDSPQHGRQTTKKNLIPLCHHHHHIKTADSFTVKVIEPGRSIEWTSQHTGHTHHVNHTHDYRPDQQPDILAGWEC
ncbi:MAG TPA: HNH endonuclease signature motif containing protein, partial [Actinocrinis sp.]